MIERSSLEVLVAKVGNVLAAQNKLIVTAESCTGGLIAEALTSVGGSTAWFDRAFITYSYESKQDMLGVQASTLKTAGAVSAECVSEMVSGALANSMAKISIACSGVAGPGGGTPEKPVGTVWVAWGLKKDNEENSVITRCFQFEGDRNAVRQACTVAALEGVLDLVNS